LAIRDSKRPEVDWFTRSFYGGLGNYGISRCRSDREVAKRFSGISGISPRQRIMKQIGFFYIEGLEAGGALKREEM